MLNSYKEEKKQDKGRVQLADSLPAASAWA